MAYKRKYDYGCVKCNTPVVLEATLEEFNRLTENPNCPKCGAITARRWLVNVPRTTQHKGHYNSNYAAQKETIALTKAGGERVNTTSD